jgi:hypothetical protein
MGDAKVNAPLPTTKRKTAGRPPAWSGAGLVGAARAQLERSFGRDLGNVRVHTDGAAGAVARSVRAPAVTVGTDVYLDPARLGPHTSTQRLLAHEVAHVVQQEGAARIDSAAPSGAHEAEAWAAADAAVVGRRTSVKAGQVVPPVQAADTAVLAETERGAADSVRADLERERAATYATLSAVQNRIATLAPHGKARARLSAAETAELTALRKREKKLEPVVEKLDDDLEVLTQPGASKQAIEEVVARRRGGTATSTKRERASFDSKTFSKVSSSTVTSTLEKGAEGTKTREEVRTSEVDLKAASISRSRRVRVESKTEGDSSGSSEEVRHKISPDGYTRTTEHVERKGEEAKTATQSTDVSRGEGKVTFARETASKTGRVEKDELVKGTELSSKTGVDVIASGKGVGLGTSTTRDFTKVHQEGLKTGVSTSAAGNFTISVEETTDDPPRYLLVLKINLSASVGGKGSRERDLGSADVSAKASGSGEVTFRHEMSKSEAEAYLTSLGVAEGGAAKGKNPEFAIIAAAARGGARASEGLVPDVLAAFGSAEAARQMSEGDSMEYKLAGKAEGEIGVDVKGVGATTGRSVSAARTMRLTKQRGMLVVTKEITTGAGRSLGASAGAGVVKGSVEKEDESSKSRSVTFKLDPGSRQQFDAQFGAIAAASSKEDVERLLKQWPDVVEQTVKSSEGSKTSSTLGLGKIASVQLGTGIERSTEVKDTAKTRSYTEGGSSTLRGSGKVLFLPKLGSEHKEEFSGTATFAKTRGRGESMTEVTGEVSETDTDTSLAVMKKLEQDPIGVLTGGTELSEESVHVSGLKLRESDFDAIVAKARDERAWMKLVASPRVLPEWQAAGELIRDAPDHRAVLQVLAAFAAGGGPDRGLAIERVLRGVGLGETGGIRFEFPPSLASYRAAFDELVLEDPVEKLRELAAEEKDKEVAAEAERIATKLRGLAATLESHRGDFKNVAARGEMLRRTAARYSELGPFTRKLDSGSGELRLPAGRAVAPDVASDYQSALAECASFKQDETTTFEQIAATYRGSFLGLTFNTRPGLNETIANNRLLNNLGELYSQWKPELERARRLGGQLGRPASEIDAVAPDRARFQRFQDEGRIQTATGKPPM